MKMTSRLLGHGGSVSLLFAASIVPLLLVVGLAVDYSFYGEAQAQLATAADVAAIHAVRVALQAEQKQQTNFLTQGQVAGQQWFVAQKGQVPMLLGNATTATVTLNSNAADGSISAQVNYSGVIATQFGRLIPATWPNWPNWGITGTATAVAAPNAYVEIDMLLDNSPSMVIAADPPGIAAMNAMTPCSAMAGQSGQTIDAEYIWQYNPTTAYGGPNNASSQIVPGSNPTTYVPYGYGTFFYQTTPGGPYINANEAIPPSSQVTGACNPAFTGPSNECYYLPAKLPISTTTNSYGYPQCVNSQGTPSGGGDYAWCTNGPSASGCTGLASNFPYAPCAFACHWAAPAAGQTYSNDYYGLSRQNNILLRLDVVKTAAENVVQTLINSASATSAAAPYRVGVYSFDTSLSTLYAPPTILASAGDETAALNGALSAVTSMETPIVINNPDTDFNAAMASLAGELTPAGNGQSSSAPRKNLFIVTDGLNDYFDSSKTQVLGPFDPTVCTAIKNLGYQIYVLYTDYYPVPHVKYINAVKQYTEPTGPTSPVSMALKACASSPANYFEANNSGAIATAMQEMLASALASPSRLSK